MKELEIAWAAGFLDGEGHFYIICAGAARRWRVGITASQKRRLALDRLRSLFGGWVGRKEQHYRGVPYPIHHWELSGAENVRTALDQLHPFLLEKQQQSALLREYIALGPGPRGAFASYRNAPLYTARTALGLRLKQLRAELV